MKIVQIASEMAPIAKVGGLADVLMGLGRELSKEHDVLVVLPHYGCLDSSKIKEEKREAFSTFFNGESHEGVATYVKMDGIRLVLLDTKEGFWKKSKTIYGATDEVVRFLIFSKCAVDWLLESDQNPDIVHVHDWQAALIPKMIDLFDKRKKLHAKTVLTLHNLNYQGACSWLDLHHIDIPFSNDLQELFKDPHHDYLNLLKAGILFADAVTTVSPTYAKEILTPEGGKGLHEVLKMKSPIYGILNGLDYSYWNPEHDSFLYEKFSTTQEMEKIFAAKTKNREMISKKIGLPFDESVPLVASVTRLVHQKGIQLLKESVLQAKTYGMQCVILGSVFEDSIRAEFMKLDSWAKEQGVGRILLSQDESLAHEIYAASSMFLVPSLFEPCGLTQLIALKYGSVPIVRKTGGLADTIVDFDYHQNKEPNGFSFDHPDQAGLESALFRALGRHKEKSLWKALVCRGMRQDFSWSIPAKRYVALYDQLRSTI